MARDLNSVFIVGRLTAHPEFKVTPSGKELLKCRIANNRQFGQPAPGAKAEVNFFDLDIWGKTAMVLKDYLVKGKQIAVTGRIQQDRWDQDGQQRSRVYLIAENVQLLGGGDTATGRQGAEPAPEPESPAPDSGASVGGNPDNEDIPF